VTPSEVRLYYTPCKATCIDGNAKIARAICLRTNLSKLSTNAYIEIRMALAMGDIWAVRQDKQDNNTTEDGLNSKAFLAPSQTNNTDAVEEKLQRELQDSRTRKAELQKQNEQLEDILHFREKELSPEVVRPPWREEREAASFHVLFRPRGGW
jgi:hypothetical protein